MDPLRSATKLKLRRSWNQAVSRGLKCEKSVVEPLNSTGNGISSLKRHICVKTRQEIPSSFHRVRFCHQGARCSDVAEGLCILENKTEAKAEIWQLRMPKKVSAMCFFLPQVHGHKAQFPSSNRAARASLSFSYKNKGPSARSKQGGHRGGLADGLHTGTERCSVRRERNHKSKPRGEKLTGRTLAEVSGLT